MDALSTVFDPEIFTRAESAPAAEKSMVNVLLDNVDDANPVSPWVMEYVQLPVPVCSVSKSNEIGSCPSHPMMVSKTLMLAAANVQGAVGLAV
jgi:hypothetical protein